MAESLDSTSSMSSDDMDELNATYCIEKINKAEDIKNEGNEHFKQKDYKSAMRSYHKALMYVKGAQHDINPSPVAMREPLKLSPETDEKLAMLSISIYNNLAACLLLKSPPNYERVLENCEEVIKLQEENVKAWYRKAQALLGLNKSSDAKSAALRANRLADAKDSAIRKLLVKIDEEMKAEQASFDSMFKNKLKPNLC